MLANRIRNAAVAFAGASLLATSLLAPIAAAAPIGQPTTAGAESVSDLPSIRLARADIQVQPTGRTGVGSHVTYKFNIKNAGPDKMTFHIDSRFNAHMPNDHQMFSTDFSTHMTLNNGETKAFEVVCNSPHLCYSGSVFVDKVAGVDTNFNNNLKVIHTDDF